MKKKIITLFTKLAEFRVKLLDSINRSDTRNETLTEYVDLAPTELADKFGVYTKALIYATNNKKVSNIALTGPYGSGKSSIIQTFLRQYKRSVLHISLAAFLPESSTGVEVVNRHEIERSILQQMLYGADANKLPLSRFKRIQSPGFWSILKSLFIMTGIFAVSFLFVEKKEVISGKYFIPLSFDNWIKLGVFVFAIIFIWIVFHHLYVASFGLALKSVSLKDVEIKPANEDEASILNRHLDEIVYFFQSTKYDLVIIEDLDRFNNADVFVTLREINSLVNKNSGVKRSIRFLYALRDDMFVNTDRTKFFEFIVPVIPIVSTSNSIDMVLEQGRRLALEDRLCTQFLREVSRYLNDLRLIQNIFNEYAIYLSNLENDGESVLDANKLLAILIYKNVYPKDFEQLHRDEGILAGILNLKDDLIESNEKLYRSEIVEIEKKIELAERQTPIDLIELRRIYFMEVFQYLPPSANRVSFNQNNWVELNQVINSELFENIIQSNVIHYTTSNSGHYQQVNISKVHSESNLLSSYKRRKEEILLKSKDNKGKALNRIKELRLLISSLRTERIKDLIRRDYKMAEEYFNKIPSNRELARFLVLEGYLDDTYYQYTSLFHSGRLSPNDNKFLIHIRAYNTPEPDFPLDKPKEVIAAMRDEDFDQSYCLNVKIIDTIFEQHNEFSEQRKKIIKFFSCNFERCDNFFDIFYSNGINVNFLLLSLSENWEGFVPTIVRSSNATGHVTQVISNLPENSLQNLVIKHPELSQFVAHKLVEILMLIPEIAPERLQCLDFEVDDLNDIKDHSLIVRSLVEEGLFKLTISNLRFVYENILAGKNITSFLESNFTTICDTGYKPLLNRIETDFVTYFQKVVLSLEDNNKEAVPSIINILNYEGLSDIDLRKFLEQQTLKLSNLQSIPAHLYALVFETGAIEATWYNCAEFLDKEEFDASSLVNFLEREVTHSLLLKEVIADESITLSLANFIAGSDELSNPLYTDYLGHLPNQIEEFPKNVSVENIEILVNSRKVIFSSNNIEFLESYNDLKVLYIASDINIFLDYIDDMKFDYDFLIRLLQSDIDGHSVCRIVKLIDPQELIAHPEDLALIGSLILSKNASLVEIDGNIVLNLIQHAVSTKIKISLFNKFHSLLTSEEITKVISLLPKPYCEITTGYHTPRLDLTVENRKFVELLEDKKIISSSKETGYSDKKIKINLFRH